MSDPIDRAPVGEMSEQLMELIIALYNDQQTAGNPNIVQCATLVPALRFGLRFYGFYGAKILEPAPQQTFEEGPSVPAPEPLSAEQLAQRFHETYERLAPAFGYATRPESAKPWAEVPENNRRLMIAVAADVLAFLTAKSNDSSKL
jgi:hypothetical protein